MPKYSPFIEKALSAVRRKQAEEKEDAERKAGGKPRRAARKARKGAARVARVEKRENKREAAVAKKKAREEKDVEEGRTRGGGRRQAGSSGQLPRAKFVSKQLPAQRKEAAGARSKLGDKGTKQTPAGKNLRTGDAGATRTANTRTTTRNVERDS